MSRGSGRNVSLDGLRALAVGLVFMHHVDQGRFVGGFLGVDLFFVLSGYLITTLLLTEWDREQRIWLKGFYARRFLRLMPALVLLVVVVTPLGTPYYLGRLVDPLAAATYTMNLRAFLTDQVGGLFAHTWSLAVEEQFYVVWPLLLIYALRRRYRLSGLVLALVVACVAVTTLAALAGHGVWGNGEWEVRVSRLPTTHAPELGMGILLAVALRGGARPRWLRSAQLPAVAGALLALLLAAVFLIDPSAPWLYVGGFALIGALGAVLVAHLLLAPGSPVSKAFRFAPAVWLGERSYGFYLWHYPVLLLLGRHLTNDLGRGTAGLLLTLVLTQASWLWIEQPFLRRKRRFEPAARLTEQPLPSGDLR